MKVEVRVDDIIKVSGLECTALYLREDRLRKNIEDFLKKYKKCLSSQELLKYMNGKKYGSVRNLLIRLPEKETEKNRKFYTRFLECFGYVPTTIDFVSPFRAVGKFIRLLRNQKRDGFDYFSYKRIKIFFGDDFNNYHLERGEKIVLLVKRRTHNGALKVSGIIIIEGRYFKKIPIENHRYFEVVSERVFEKLRRRGFVDYVIETQLPVFQLQVS